MEYLLPINKTSEVSFKVSVSGTSAPPQKVSLVLEKNQAAVAYEATKVGDSWVAIVERPGGVFGDGLADMSIQVVVGGRLFVPFKAQAMIAYEAAPVAHSPTIPPESVATPALPAVEGTNTVQTAPPLAKKQSVLQSIETALTEAPKIEKEVKKVEQIKKVIGAAEIKKLLGKPKQAAKATQVQESLKPLQIKRKETIKESAVVVSQPVFKLTKKKIVTI